MLNVSNIYSLQCCHGICVNTIQAYVAVACGTACNKQIDLMAHLKLVTFDVTNTLIHLRSSVGEQYVKIAQLYGIKCKNEDLPKRINESFFDIIKEMKKNHPNFGVRSGLTSQQWWEKVVFKSFQSSGCLEGKLYDKELKLASKHLYKLYSTETGWSADPAAHQVLSQIKKTHAHLSFGVISNFDERLESILISLGLRHYFDFIISSIEFHCQKPDKQIFNIALSKSKVNDSKQAIHIGDNINLDYLAAKNAGWNALIVKDIKLIQENDLLQVNKNEIVNNLSELPSHEYFSQ